MVAPHSQRALAHRDLPLGCAPSRHCARQYLLISITEGFRTSPTFLSALSVNFFGPDTDARCPQHHCRPTPTMINFFARMLPHALPQAGHLQPQPPRAASASLPSHQRCKGPKSLAPLPPAARQDPDRRDRFSGGSSVPDSGQMRVFYAENKRIPKTEDWLVERGRFEPSKPLIAPTSRRNSRVKS